MTGDEMRAIRAKIGYTQAMAARSIGVYTRTWRRWEREERGIPEPIAKLVRLMESLEVREALVKMIKRGA